MSDWYSPEMDWKWNLGNIWDKLTHPFRRVFWWIIKSVQYSILLWNDFDWDYSYILLLLQYKLRRTRKAILKNNLIVRADEVAAQIKHAEDLIEKWKKDDFCRDLYEAHEKKWGKIVDLSEPFEMGGMTMYKWNMSREKATTPELQEQERKETMEIHNKAEAAKEKNFDELFNHLRKYIQEWWD